MYISKNHVFASYDLRPILHVMRELNIVSMSITCDDLIMWKLRRYAHVSSLPSSLRPTIFGYGSIPIDTFLVGWTSIYQLFWCSPGVQGFDPSPFFSKCPKFSRNWMKVGISKSCNGMVTRSHLWWCLFLYISRQKGARNSFDIRRYPTFSMRLLCHLSS